MERSTTLGRRAAAAALLAAAGLVGLGACATGGAGRELERLVAARGVEPDRLVFPDRLSEEMRQWLSERLPARADPAESLPELLRLLEDADGLGLRYQAGYTGTAQEVFESRSYNCLSFSHLFIAFARELGADAYYMAVGRIRRFRREGDVVLVSGHVTVGFGVGTGRRHLEFNVGPDVSYRTAEPISDLTALALFHSNRGAEMIQAGELAEALRWLETAARLEPALPGAWVNLGVARRRLGDLEGAEQAYLRATEIDEAFFPAYRNLAALYLLRGQRDAVGELIVVLERRGNRNPYTFLALGDLSMEEGRLDEAGEFYRRALRLSSDKAEAQAALGQLALQRGDAAAARRWLSRARQSDPAADRVASLALELEPVAGGEVRGARPVVIEEPDG